jgi:hypothetical protein
MDPDQLNKLDQLYVSTGSAASEKMENFENEVAKYI